MDHRKLKMTMLTDYHIASGTGIPGICDSALLTDYDGFPIVPGSTISGVLRDLIEDWIKMAGNKFPWKTLINAWQENPQYFIDEVFGKAPFSGCLQFSCCMLPEEIRKQIQQIAAKNSMKITDIVSDFSYIAPHLAIEDTTGIVEPGKFFTVEMGRAGLIFEGDLHCNADSSKAQAIFFVLEQVLPYLTRLGNKRTRGFGCVKCELSPCTPGFADSEISSITTASSTILRVRATLTEPCHIAADPFQGNHSACCDYIPGAAILGILAWRWLQLGQPLDNVFQKFFCSPQTRFLNLYPVAQGAKEEKFPTFPISLSWGKNKRSQGLPPWEGSEAGEESLDMLHDQDALFKHPWDQRNIQHFDKGFAVFPENTEDIYSYTIQHSIVHHNVVDDEEKRVLEKSGGPFSQEALVEGQIFEGYILLDHKKELQEFLERLRLQALPIHLPVRLGHAKRRGMGHAMLELDVPNADDIRLFPGTQPKDLPEGSTFIVKFLSDAILKDDWGRPMTSLHAEILQKHLESLGAQGITIKAAEVSHYAKLDTLQGFYSHWGLPRPEETLIQKGSVFQFILTQGCLPAAIISNFNQSSIGYRCQEGFGRIMVDRSSLSQNIIPAHHNPAPFKSITFPDFNAPAQGLLALLRNARYTNNLLKEIHAKIGNVSIQNPLKPNQWAALREAALQAYQWHEKAIAAEYQGQEKIQDCLDKAKNCLEAFYKELLGENGEPKKGRDSWSKCLIDGTQAYVWLKTMIDAGPEIWKSIYIPKNEKTRWLWGMKSLFLALLADAQRRKA